MNKENGGIKCEELVKIYNKGRPNECRALRGVNLTIKKGEFLIIMGHSGSGKSTLLNQISCLDTPTDGKVLIDGIDISKLSSVKKAELRREKLGFVFQQFNLIKSMSAIENIMLPMEFAGKPEGKSEKYAKKLLELVGLSDKANNPPTEMSGGEQQRVAIARALANNPEIILADEPTGNLDSKTGETIMDILVKLNKEGGKTLIIVTHESNIVAMANRAVRLEDGKVTSDSKRR